MARQYNFQRRAPLKGHPLKSTKMVKIGGQWLPPHEASFLTEYLKHFNGIRAAKSAGLSQPQFAAGQLIRKPQIKVAIRNSLEERLERTNIEADDITRYWYQIATADPRELSQHIYVPCRYCWGIDHQYQFTDGEMRSELQKHLSVQNKKPVRQRVEFDDKGGPGYTINRYPMRGSDWLDRITQVYSDIGRPVPEGLEANSDHSCPECHGHGERYVWFADTRHLSTEAALLYNGVKLTTTGSLEFRMMDRADAMIRLQALLGLNPTQKFEIATDAKSLTDEELSKELARRGVVVDGTFQDVSEGTESVLESVGGEETEGNRQLVGFVRPDLLRKRGT